MSSGPDILYSHRGFRVPDPFAPRQKPAASFFHAVLATALFQCWHILLMFTAWSALITVLNAHGYQARFQSTLLTVLGTVLGFVISYRTTSSFERYNEGRRLWSQIILGCRTLARTIWFHVPDPNPSGGSEAQKEEAKMRSLIEKKTAINLLEAFAVSVKHYLRGEDGIYYKDLYYLIKYLPGYALPAGRPSFNSEHSASDINGRSTSSSPGPNGKPGPSSGIESTLSPQDSHIHQRSNTGYSTTKTLIPLPATSPTSTDKLAPTISPDFEHRRSLQGRDTVVVSMADEELLLPGYLPPTFSILDIFPLSLFAKCFTRGGNQDPRQTEFRLRAKFRTSVSHNIPLEISLYLSSYVAALQQRKVMDVPTTNALLGAVSQLVDSLTGLERILTTPIPFSYSFHLWVVTGLYCWALPFQLWSTFGWLTIPGTAAASFVYFGFLVAGEEIENPFGYDKNDLNLDHFTHNIIRNELRAVTSAPPPDPSRWAFSPENNLVFASHYETDERITPEDWLKRDSAAMLAALHADEPTNAED